MNPPPGPVQTHLPHLRRLLTDARLRDRVAAAITEMERDGQVGADTVTELRALLAGA